MIKDAFPKESEEEENTSKTIRFTRLQHLKFQNLPSLTTFSKEIDSIEFSSLSNLDIYDLAAFKSLCTQHNSHISTDINIEKSLVDGNVSFPGARRLEIRGLNTVHEIWSSEVKSTDFLRLEVLVIKSSCSCKSLFSSSMAEGLKHLKELQVQISDCKMMKEVIAEEEEHRPGKQTKSFFPQLERLELGSLHDLRTFCHVNHSLE
ncbi:hypothetical protein ACH5RR_003174 [Cinchona calisaya]|uniref:Disease resistance protein At4g27190-like leucine-rich repeats domain-containing protein n=1 Tax=Cinchona calisaya TaxID=153742 RepID=A0ABD3AU25_9GENT